MNTESITLGLGLQLQLAQGTLRSGVSKQTRQEIHVARCVLWWTMKATLYA